jgi:hypothetical protein
MNTVVILISLLSAAPATEGHRCVDCPPLKHLYREQFNCKSGLEKHYFDNGHRCIPPRKRVAPKKRAAAAPAPIPARVEVVEKVVERVVEKPVVVEKVVTKEVVKEVVKEVPAESPWQIMAYGQVGAHADTDGYPATTGAGEQQDLHGRENNWISYGGGTEFHHLPTGLGLRAFVGNNGIGGLLQLFPVQGKNLSWYVGAGAAFTEYPFYRPTVPAVAREFDFQVGTGVEYALTKNLILLCDAKASIPLGSVSGEQLGKALLQTSLLAGLGYRF